MSISSDKIIHCNSYDNGISITEIGGRTGSPCRWFRIKDVTNTSSGLSLIDVAKDVIKGLFGDGDSRIAELKAMDYNPNLVQAEVNKQLGLAVKIDLGQVAKDVIANKYGCGESERKSGVKVTQGMARPQSEDGHYVHYNSVDDFIYDCCYL